MATWTRPCLHYSSLACCCSSRVGRLAGVSSTLGALTKPLALLALPAFWRPWNWRLPLAPQLTIVLAYLPYLSVGLGVLAFVPGYVQEEGFASGSGSGFKLLWLAEHVAGPLPPAARNTPALAALGGSPWRCASDFGRIDRHSEAWLRAVNWLMIAFLVLIFAQLSLVLPCPRPVSGALPVDHRLGPDERRRAVLRCLFARHATQHSKHVSPCSRWRSLPELTHDLWGEWRKTGPRCPFGETT